MSIVTKFNKLYAAFRKGGIRNTISLIKKRLGVSPKIKRGNSRSVYHEGKRIDSEKRWHTIASYLEPTDKSAIDIGCASGYFTAQLARSGMFSIGIDIDRARLDDANKLFGRKTRLAFMEYHLSPETIDYLPTFDVALLLTVYHHWTNNYGRIQAENMLRVIAARTNKIFFEVPGAGCIEKPENLERWPVAERLKVENESINDYYTWILNEIFLNDVKVEYLGEFPYMSSSQRKDSMFLIRCGNYRI